MEIILLIIDNSCQQEISSILVKAPPIHYQIIDG